MNLFLYTNYREVIRKFIELKKEKGQKITYQELADIACIPRSYLSKVINSSGTLNTDQLWSICNYLNFSSEEIEFMLLLLELERSTIPERQDVLQHDLKCLKNKALSSKSFLTSKETQSQSLQELRYFSDPMNQIVHLVLQIPRLQKFIDSKDSLSKILGISSERLAECLQCLEDLELIFIQNSKIQIETPNIHLSPDSYIFSSWKNTLRSLGVNKTNSLSKNDYYNFSAVFTANKETIEQIHSNFLTFLKDAQNLATHAQVENVYQINFDIFPWTT